MRIAGFVPYENMVLLALFAVAFPTLLAFNVAPSATFINQAAAIIGWACFLVLFASSTRSHCLRIPSALAGLLATLVILGLAALASMRWASAPAPLVLSVVGLIATAMVVTAVGATVGRAGYGAAAFRALCIALVAGGLLSVGVGIVQVFAPNWADGAWIASTAATGRASGNLRQPNHLSSLLLWSMVAVLWLGETRQLSRRMVAAMMIGFVFVLVLAASRTGVVGVAVLALWGLLDRRLSRWTRAVLLLAPIMYLLFFGGLSLWAHASHQVFGGEARLAETSDSPNSRWNIWANAAALIAQHPWFGVGTGEFNFAWTLTPFPNRPTAFFDHTHNLPLQLAVELGIPLALAVMALLVYALWRAFVAGRDAALPEATMLRAAFMMVLMIGIHSMFEYPLWYAYFLLPTAFAWGLCLGHGRNVEPETRPASRRLAPHGLVFAACLMFVGGLFSIWDYLRVVQIFEPSKNAPSLAVRIAEGQRSVFFAHHADYAAATTAEHPSEVMDAFKRAPHYLLDARLMIAWARALNESGDVERARYIAQRLKEFRHPLGNEFFAACDKPPPLGETLPFQCTPPTRSFTFKDFR